MHPSLPSTSMWCRRVYMQEIGDFPRSTSKRQGINRAGKSGLSLGVSCLKKTWKKACMRCKKCQACLKGHSCKIGNMRCAGTLEEQNHQFKRQYECWLVFRCKHHTPWEKNDGPPYLTLWSLFSKSIEKSHVPAQQKQISSDCSLHKTYFFVIIRL